MVNKKLINIRDDGWTHNFIYDVNGTTYLGNTIKVKWYKRLLNVLKVNRFY